MTEGVLADQLATDSRPEKLLGDTAAPAACVVREILFRFEIRPPRIGVGFCNCPQDLVRAEVVDQVAASVPPYRAGRLLHVGPLGEVGVQILFKRCDDRLGDQIDGRELVRHRGIELRNPSGGFVRDSVPGDRRGYKVLDAQLDRFGGASRDFTEADRLALAGAIGELDQAATIFEF
ncbi:MAG: hypothetical protein H6819_04845 [Phycisphaerales bacterium]|nr:hypothetical protein [Phycisphaerales bacterium]MCB9856528.1 hypothetical protein [Phycisphaerales bacterium]